MIEYAKPVVDWLNNNPIALGFPTLITAILGTIYTVKTFRHGIKMVEPWELTKIKDEYWVLERKHPKLATIYAEEVTPDFRGHKVIIVTPSTDGFYKKGSKAVIQVIPSDVGSVFNLYYVEHRSNKLPRRLSGHRDDFTQRNRDLDTPPHGVRHWSSPLY